MKRSPSAALILALASLAIAPVPARAWTEFLSMDVLPENAGWASIFDDRVVSSSVVSGGILTLTAGWFREYRAPANWIGTVSASTGYTIEFRLRILTECNCYPGREIGVWYYDNTNLTILSIDPGRIYLEYPISGQPWASLNATVWHTYRIVVLGSHHQVFVDDVLTLDYQHPGTGGGGMVLEFGDQGACGYDGQCNSRSEWDYFAYQTSAVVPVERTSWGKLKALYRAGL